MHDLRSDTSSRSDTRIRVTVFGNDNGVGGAQTAFRRLVKFLRDEEYYVNAISVGRRDEDADDSEPDSLDGITIATLPTNTRSISATIRKLTCCILAALRLRAIKPNFFITVGLSESAGFISSLLPSTTRRIAFDFIADRDMSSRIVKSTLRRFDDIAVQSPSMRTALAINGVASHRIFALPCFPGPDFPAAAKSGRSRMTAQVRLAYFGRLAPNKGLVELLRILKAQDGDPPLALDIWGRGQLHQCIASEIEQLNGRPPVKLNGWYPVGAAGAKLMSGYDGIIVPSQGLEGIPLVLIEAMALGIPALCTNVGAIRDCCEGNPDFVLTEPNVEALTQGLSEFVGRLQLGQFDHDRLRFYYQRNFAFEAVARQWRGHLLAANLCTKETHDYT